MAQAIASAMANAWQTPWHLSSVCYGKNPAVDTVSNMAQATKELPKGSREPDRSLWLRVFHLSLPFIRPNRAREAMNDA